MSGEAGGLMLLPLALFALPIVGTVMVGGAIVAGGAAAVRAGANAARKHAEERNRRISEIESGALNETIGSFRKTLSFDMNEQLKLNRQASDEMNMVLDINRTDMQNFVDVNDPEKYREYLSKIKKSREDVSNRLISIEDNFVKNYHEKIEKSMSLISDRINTQYAGNLKELENLNHDIQEKEKKAGEFAEKYLEETRGLIESLRKDYEGERFSYEALNELEKAFNDAFTQFNHGHYEAAIASSKDTALQTIDEIYKADCKMQEFDNYHTLAVSLASEIETFLTHQEFITAEFKAEVEKKTGKTLEDDVVGIRIADYTDLLKDGSNQFDYLLSKIKEIKTFLESDKVKEITVEQMKNYVDLLSNKMYPAAANICYKGILNMNNAFSRQNVSEQIIDFFEEHNFDFTGYSYDDNRHDGTLRIGLENDTTGEEIIVTLAPELMQNGDVQTKLEIDQIKGDETNEERKQYYRDSIKQVVCENTPGAKVALECVKGTKNKLSTKTELKDRLKV